MKCTSLEITCSACPSQWDGVLANGKRIYIRYRFGILTAETYESNIFDRSLLLAKDLNDKWGGVLSTEEMISHLEGTVDFSQLDPVKTS